MTDVGKHNEIPDSEFDPNELKMGIEVEMEHTDDSYVAKNIAKDHLVECPDYYTRLKAMENKCESKMRIILAKNYALPVPPSQIRQARGNKMVGYVLMDPFDFLKLTTGSASSIKEIMENAKDISVYQSAIRSRDNSIMPFLGIEVRKMGDKAGEVVGHEGRHRAAAIIKAVNDGVIPKARNSMAVSLRVRTETSEWLYRKEEFVNGMIQRSYYGKEIIPEMWVGQFNSSVRFKATDILRTFKSFY